MPLYLFSSIGLYAQQKDMPDSIYRRPLFDFDIIRPVFKFNKEQQSNTNRFLRYSVLTGYREGVEPIKGWANFAGYTDTLTGTRRLYMFNLSIEEMLTHGMKKTSQVLLEVKDPSKYRYDSTQGSKDAWLKKNAHCYELLLPVSAITSSKQLEDDLAKTLGVRFGIEKRFVNALVLIRTSNKDKIKSSGKEKPETDMKTYFRNVLVNYLAYPLMDADMPPMVDETGYKDHVDLILNISDWKDLVAVRKALRKYDLDLKEEKRELEMFVITEIR
ncbi:hypothetical protein SAMN05443550_1216 [Pedobacter hartonius]|uniref:Uncharacterized protein n=1 Tax=Pedobacter hartonius TaxID=425514 RepID=A0A1H4HIZ6_9SPHI|nr:hypothetical protein SAMN05443550_1216 [Pedobacter hartonius]